MLMTLLRVVALLAMGMLAGRAGAQPASAPAPLGPTAAPATQPAGVTPAGYGFTWTRLYTTGDVNLLTGKCDYSVSLEGRLGLPDDSDLVQACRALELIEAVDQDGRSLLAALPASVGAIATTRPGERGGPVREFELLAVRRRPNSFVPVYLTLSRLPLRPRVLQRAAGRAYLRTAAERATKDLPAAKADTFSPVLPNLACKVDRLEPRGGLLAVTVDFRKDGIATGRDVFAAPYVADIALLDEQGQVVSARGVSSTWLGDPKVGFVGSVLAQFPAPAQPPKTLRVTVVTKLQERVIPFEVRDLPVQ